MSSSVYGTMSLLLLHDSRGRYYIFFNLMGPCGKINSNFLLIFNVLSALYNQYCI